MWSFHADAGIAHPDVHVFTRSQVQSGFVPVGDNRRLHADGNTSAPRNGFLRVGDEVQQDLVELTLVDADVGHVLTEVQLQLDALTEQTRQRRLPATNGAQHVRGPFGHRRDAAKLRQAGGQRAGFVHGLKDLPPGVGLRQEFGESGNDGQQVVEVVCNTRRQHANPFEFLRLNQPLARAPFLAQITTRKHPRVRVAVSHRHAKTFHPHPVPFHVAQSHLMLEPLIGRLTIMLQRHLGIVRVHEVEQPALHQFLGRITEHRFRTVACLHDLVVHRQDVGGKAVDRNRSRMPRPTSIASAMRFASETALLRVRSIINAAMPTTNVTMAADSPVESV